MGEAVDGLNLLPSVPGAAGQVIQAGTEAVDAVTGLVDPLTGGAASAAAALAGAGTAAGQMVVRQQGRIGGEVLRAGLPRDDEGWSGGNGVTQHRTIIQQRMVSTGAISFVVIPGKPKLMGRDLQTAKRVFNTIRKANSKLPRRTVKETDAAKVKKAINTRIIEQITCDPKPPC